MNHDASGHPSTAPIGTETAIAGVRLRPTAPNRGGAWAALSWVSGTALALAAGWFVFALVSPLEVPEDNDAVQRPPAARLVERSTDVGSRQAVLMGLTAENVYSHKRAAWPTGAGGSAIAGGAEGAEGAASGSGSESAALAPEAVIPPDIKPAFDNLRLVGLFEIASKPAVMVSFVSGSDAAKSHVYRVGEEFTDPAHPAPAWKVAGIDLQRKSAVLARAGRQVELRMFANVPAVAKADAAPGQVAPAPAPVVVPATRAEVIAKLREAKISEAEIALLLKELGPEPGAPEAGVTGEATAQAIDSALKNVDGVSSGAPPGLEEVLKLMSQTRNRGTAAPNPAPAPAPAPAPVPPISGSEPKPAEPAPKP